MNYWITTHWPKLADSNEFEHDFGVWVQDGKADVLAEMKTEDLVFIYESRSGRDLIRKDVHGHSRRIQRAHGREGIVALAQVTDMPREAETSKPQMYDDGGSAWWRYFAPVKTVDSSGFVPRSVLNSILGYSGDYVLRGFGDRNSGVKRIDRGVFDLILEKFVFASRMAERSSRAAAFGHFGGSGEGPEHLELKRRIASDPATVLGEPGLTLVEMERSFVTNDRVDVLLRDALGRFVAVEVEVDCGEQELAGPLQCMKYRAMLSYLLNRPIHEVRTMLVAHSIHQDVQRRCNNHQIESKTVARLSSTANNN